VLCSVTSFDATSTQKIHSSETEESMSHPSRTDFFRKLEETSLLKQMSYTRRTRLLISIQSSSHSRSCASFPVGERLAGVSHGSPSCFAEVAPHESATSQVRGPPLARVGGMAARQTPHAVFSERDSSSMLTLLLLEDS
jgi:hypothetical protein